MNSSLLRADYRPRLGFLNWFQRLSFLLVHSLSHKGNLAVILFRAFEPMSIIALLSSASYIVGAGAPFGDSLILFNATGVVPYYLFFHTAMRLRYLDTATILPRITMFDDVLCKASSEFFIKLFIFLIICPILIYVGARQWFPAFPMTCFCALAAICLLGAIVGVISANIAAFIPEWRYAFLITARAAMMISAVPLVMDRLPLAFRKFTLNNPLAHLITLYRYGWYNRYPVDTLDLWFVVKCFLALIFIAILFEGGTRSFRDIR